MMAGQQTEQKGVSLQDHDPVITHPLSVKPRSRSCEDVRFAFTSTPNLPSRPAGFDRIKAPVKQFDLLQNISNPDSNKNFVNLNRKHNESDSQVPDNLFGCENIERQVRFNGQSNHNMSELEPNDHSYLQMKTLRHFHQNRQDGFFPGQTMLNRPCDTYSGLEQGQNSSNRANVHHNSQFTEQDCFKDANRTYGSKKEQKEKKSITTKTFAHGLMDVSLLTSNATQLRAIMSNPDHDFYDLLIWFITLSVVLQITSGVLLIMSDFFKTQVKEKDRQNVRKRKLLNFIALAMVMVITSLNVLISAFYMPGAVQNTSKLGYEKPSFAASDYQRSHNHTEL